MNEIIQENQEKTTNITMPLAIDSCGSIHHVTGVERGMACNCFCIECGEMVIAKKGDILEHHFAHSNLSSCGGYSPMTPLHKVAEDLIMDGLNQGIIIGPINPVPNSTWSKEQFYDLSKHNRKSDVSSGDCHIEVRVSHAVDDGKISDLYDFEGIVYELDLSDCDYTIYRREDIWTIINNPLRWRQIQVFDDARIDKEEADLKRVICEEQRKITRIANAPYIEAGQWVIDNFTSVDDLLGYSYTGDVWYRDDPHAEAPSTLKGCVTRLIKAIVCASMGHESMAGRVSGAITQYTYYPGRFTPYDIANALILTAKDYRYASDMRLAACGMLAMNYDKTRELIKRVTRKVRDDLNKDIGEQMSRMVQS